MVARARWLLVPCAVLLGGCDLTNMLAGAPAGTPSGSTMADVTAAVARSSGDGDRDRMVLDVAARDLACPRDSVALALTFDRHFANGLSLRYLVEGCGARALYGEDCSRMDACRYILVSRTASDGLERLAPVLVPARSPTPALPPELAGLSVSLEPRLVGDLARGETPERAMTTCRAGDAQLVRALGWTVADDPAKADLVGRFGCTGHVEVDTHGTTVDLRLPYDGTASVVLMAGERVVAAVPPSPTHLTCESTVRDAQTDCLERAGAMTSARIATALAASPELKEFARSRHPKSP